MLVFFFFGFTWSAVWYMDGDYEMGVWRTVCVVIMRMSQAVCSSHRCTAFFNDCQKL